MWLYLLKSSACLAILLLFYKIFMERESFHTFKRFFLLGAILFSSVVPALVFKEEVVVVYPQVETALNTVTYTNTSPVPAVPDKFETDINDFASVLWVIYIAGMAFFGLRFFKNLIQIFRRIRNNPKQRVASFIRVLLSENLPPHTFFSYIFLNKNKLQASEIPDEVLLHEETHAREKHSIDVFLVEILQVVFWFNPLIYVLRKFMKLNHEFLADSAVINKGVSSSVYQNTLLSFMSPTGNQAFINAINYSSIRLTVFGKTLEFGSAVGQVKKRFSIMKKNTSKKTALFKSLLLLPILAILLYSFTETKVVYRPADPNAATERILGEADNVHTNAPRTIEIAGLVIDSETLDPIRLAEIHNSNGELLTKTDENGYFTTHIDDYGKGEIQFGLSVYKKQYKPIFQNERWGPLTGNIESVFYFGLQNEGSTAPYFSELMLDSKKPTYESVLENLNGVRARVAFNKKMEMAKKGNQDVFLTVDGLPYLVNNFGLIEINHSNELIAIDNKVLVPAYELNEQIKRAEVTGMTPLQGQKASYAIYTTAEPSADSMQNGASEQELALYTNLAKKYNAIAIEQRIVPLKDLKVLESIYRKMTDKQRKGAQPFPECQTLENIHIYLQKDQKLLVNDLLISMDELTKVLPKFNSQMARQARENHLQSFIYPQADTSRKTLDAIEAALTGYGVARIDIVGPKESSRFPNDNGEQSSDKVLFIVIGNKNITLNGKSVPLKAFAKEVDAVTANWEAADYTNASTQVRISNAPSSFLKKVNQEFKKTQFSKATGGTGLVPPPPAPPQSPKAMAAEVVEEIIEHQDPYDDVHANAITHHHKMEVPEPVEVHEQVEEKSSWTVTGFVERDSRTSEEKEASIPIPPTAPIFTLHSDTSDYSDDLKTIVNEYLEINQSYEKAVALYKNKRKGSRQNLWDLYNQVIDKYVIYNNLAKAEGKYLKPMPRFPKESKSIQVVPSPPIPPTPQSPLDHVIEMAKKGAVFYYEGKKISSDKAIELLKNNKNLNIDSRGSKSKRPEVRISKNPIIIKR